METGLRIRVILRRAARAFELVGQESISGTGLVPSDFGILEVLLHKGPLPINTIGKKVLLTSGSMTAAVNRLVEKDLVERVQDPRDSRRFNLHLTPEGSRLVKRVFTKHANNLDRIASVLTPDEQNELVRLLKKIGIYAQGYGMHGGMSLKGQH